MFEPGAGRLLSGRNPRQENSHLIFTLDPHGATVVAPERFAADWNDWGRLSHSISRGVNLARIVVTLKSAMRLSHR